jgi:hypothetical protein
MTAMKPLLVRLIASTLVTVATISALAEDTAPRSAVIRRHFELNDKAGSAYYYVTTVRELSEVRQHVRLLVRDARFGDYILSWLRSFTDQTTVISIADLSGKAYVRITYKWPFTSKTVTDTLAEAKRHPELMDAPTIVTLDTNGGRWEAVETEWRGTERRRELRTQVRQSMNPTLLEAIERMRGTALPVSDFKDFAALATTFVLHGTAGEVQEGLLENSLHPDCDFDKSFGLPCTDKELARIKKADEEHRPITDY